MSFLPFIASGCKTLASQEPRRLLRLHARIHGIHAIPPTRLTPGSLDTTAAGARQHEGTADRPSSRPALRARHHAPRTTKTLRRNKRMPFYIRRHFRRPPFRRRAVGRILYAAAPVGARLLVPRSEAIEHSGQVFCWIKFRNRRSTI